MVAALPYPTLSSYCRAVSEHTLDRYASAACPVCPGELRPAGWGLRRFLGLKLRRAHCGRCGTNFTFLPCFLAPGKWYAYPAIAEAVEFLARPEFENSTQALDAWEEERDDRRDSGEPAGPSRSTVCRWWGELGQAGSAERWLRRSVAQVIERVVDHPLPSRVRPACTPHARAVALVLALGVLGGLVAKQFASRLIAPLLALGLWAVESRHHQRCLASASLAGRLIPGPSPSLAETAKGSSPYPPGPSSARPAT